MTLKVFGIGLIALALTACSSQPREPATAMAPAAPAAAAPSAALAASPSVNGETPAINRSRIAAGYKATVIKGETYYCRQVDVTGTQFKKKVCLNEAQLQDEERKTKELQDRMLQQGASPACSGPACGS